MKANREYELSVRKAGRGPAVLRGPGGADHVEVLEIATGEIALFWDTEPSHHRPAGAGPARRPRLARRGRVPREVAALADVRLNRGAFGHGRRMDEDKLGQAGAGH